MSKLQFDFEIIHKINEHKEIKKEEILQIAKKAPKETIFDTASNIRNMKKGTQQSEYLFSSSSISTSPHKTKRSIFLIDHKNHLIEGR